MPNRIIKESICISDNINALSWFEEVLFYRLIVNCDDFGRFDGRTAVIKNRLFPLKENLSINAVGASVKRLAACGLVTLYTFEGRPYLQLTTWDRHQTIRAKRSKFPSPEGLQANEINCMQMQANAPVIQSEYKSKYNPITTTTTVGAPSFHEVHEYFKCEAVFNDEKASFAEETAKFIAYNKNRGWDCLPDWQSAADLWAVRADEK